MAVLSQEKAPRSVGKYEIIAKIADGGMGSVFKARNRETKELVALKLASAALATDAVLLKRFEQEFKAASNLNHPNIVRGLDFGWHDTRPYLVMEYVDGEDMWARLVRVGRLPEAEAVGYVVQVAGGLHLAHKNGIIHRDIKPDNILLTADGTAKLADLGLSKDLEADTELTRPNKGLGTPNFIAPEQFKDAKHAGVRCDVYALGATLYMALTGEVPFQARGLVGILQRKFDNDLPAPRDLVPTLSEHVDWAVRRALLADPDRRFATCPEFVAALTGQAAAAPPAPAPTPRRTGRREAVPGRERRACVRYDCAIQTACAINLSVHPDDTDSQTAWDAQIRNLSVTGIGLVLARRFEAGSVLSVELQSSDGRRKHKVEMRVVRVSPAGSGRWYLGGVLAQKLSKEDLRRLL